MKKLNRLTVLITGLGLAIAAFGQNVDVENSSFSWKATKKIGSAHWGAISLKTANATFADSRFVKAVFVMDMDTFTVDNLEGEWADKFTKHVKSTDFFDVATFPTSTLVLNKQEGEIYSGTLTIKDKTQPVQVSASREGHTYSGTLSFDRTAFGVIYGSGNFFKELAADRVINNTVTLEFSVTVK